MRLNRPLLHIKGIKKFIRFLTDLLIDLCWLGALQRTRNWRCFTRSQTAAVASVLLFSQTSIVFMFHKLAR